MHHSGTTAPSLYGRDGRRKYLTPRERPRFIATAESHPSAALGTLCLVLALTGCRISEALALVRRNVEDDDAFIAIFSLKKRGKTVIREVPVPDSLIARIRTVHGATADAPERHLWSWSRTQAWRLVKAVMAESGILDGPHATPKGLRHAFGIHAIRSDVPLDFVQRWLGHANLATTAIYTQAIGPEEREIASRMWEKARAAQCQGAGCCCHTANLRPSTTPVTAPASSVGPTAT